MIDGDNWREIHQDPERYTRFMVQLKMYPYEYTLTGTAIACRLATRILDDTWRSLRNDLFATYADLLVCKEGYWELLAPCSRLNIWPMGFASPRSANILDVVYLPASNLEKSEDLYYYDTTSDGMIVLHPSRVLSFTEMLREDEILIPEILPTLIERGINSILQDVVFEFQEPKTIELERTPKCFLSLGVPYD